MNFKEIESLIESGELKECLKKLKVFADKLNLIELKNRILFESGRLKRLESKFQSNLISHEFYSQEEAKLGSSVIEIANIIEAKSFWKNDKNETPKEILSNNEKINSLEGVWACKHSSTSANLFYIWSLLPDNFCILNILNLKNGKKDSDFYKWEFDYENKIIIQTNRKGEVIKGKINLLSLNKFEVTVLDEAKTFMIYEKIY